MTGQGDRRMDHIKQSRAGSNLRIVDVMKVYRAGGNLPVRGLKNLCTSTLSDSAGREIYNGNRIWVILGEIRFNDAWIPTIWNKHGEVMAYGSLSGGQIQGPQCFQLIEWKEQSKPEPTLF